jgi:hypothetical protein
MLSSRNPGKPLMIKKDCDKVNFSDIKEFYPASFIFNFAHHSTVIVLVSLYLLHLMFKKIFKSRIILSPKILRKKIFFIVKGIQKFNRLLDNCFYCKAILYLKIIQNAVPKECNFTTPQISRRKICNAAL